MDAKYCQQNIYENKKLIDLPTKFKKLPTASEARGGAVPHAPPVATPLDNVVEVDGVNRHVADVRHGEQQHMPNLELEQQSAVNPGVELDYRADGDYADIDGDDGGNDDNAYEDDSDSSDEEPVVRDRRPPQWLVDFYIHE